MKETELQYISRKTGKKVSFCKCNLCKSQCKTPCLGTPADIERIIDAGHGDKIKLTDWAVGMVSGTMDSPVEMYQAEYNENGCVFFKDGLCSLHDAGLKPTEGKLSHHSTKAMPKMNKALAFFIAKTWLDKANLQS